MRLKKKVFTVGIKYFILVIILFLTFVPLIMMLFMSIKDSLMIYGDFWSLPNPIKLSNYSSAIFELAGPAGRTIVVNFASNFGILLFAVISAYAFARKEFPGRDFFFLLIISLMMIPQIILLTPSFILASKLGLRDSLGGLCLFYIGAHQTFAIFIMRGFFKTLPESIFDSAKIDGAGELKSIWHIILPLCRPVIITVFIMNTLYFYNDLMWPLLMINSKIKETLMPALQSFSPIAQKGVSRPDLGVQSAGYVFACIPLLFIIAFGMKYYIQGVTSGSIKA